ncbi:hypothetical protein [Nitrososphaera viennensis]|uniref:Uncharacterized protein n=2 Tax=Nitrososphaera viennensis TaxID=1034015 RepID=A0A060HL56_9ARCH|nr:hypothetical protein [Nitrososphaera viennensis]AIC14326.1 hypothetical protein NVIE_001430 [Nitrososphaera viennensis EN76]UVS69318.1 hypothetical protein NWT39_00685 [Nitrososphaera viennensis]
MGGFKIIKEKKATDYTFVDDTLSLGQADAAATETKKELDAKRDSKNNNNDIRLRDDSKINKIRHKSKITGGHSMQGHSPVYE